MKQCLWLLIFCLVALIGCNTQEVTTVALPTSSPSGSDEQVVASPIVSMTTESTAVPIPTTPPTPNSLVNGNYLTQLTSSTSHHALSNIQLAVRQVTLNENELTFLVAFENNTNELKLVQGDELRPQDFYLVDSAGVEYHAAFVSDNLRALIPVDGLPPGAANAGTITFRDLPLPETTSYTLNFATTLRYAALALDLRTLASGTIPPAPTSIANGEYLLDLTLFSTEAILAPLKLHLNNVTYTDMAITFDITFTNDGFYQGYEIRPAPTGFDAWMLDHERRPYAPLAVSDSLSHSITGEDGLDPDEINQGTITFPRVAGEGYFIFNRYVAAQLKSDGSGALYAQLVSLTEDTAVPEFTPSAEDLAYTAIENLLQQYCATITKVDYSAYLALHTQPAAPIETTFADFTRLPIADCVVELQPTATSFAWADSGLVNDLTIWLELLPAGTHPNNPFMTPLSMSFQKADDEWLVTDVSYEEDPPVWSLPNTILAESEHFYVLASAELAEAIPTYLMQVEQAYQTLSASSLPVQGKYLAIFVSPEAEYRRITGRSTSGVAPATSVPGPNDGIRNISRHFFINIENIVELPGRELEVITHELVHVVMQEHGRQAMPIWLTEGIAEYYAGSHQRIPSQDFQLVRAIHLDALMDQEILNPQQYAFAGLFIAFLAETYGENALLDFFYAYEQRPSSETEWSQTGTLTEQLVGEFFGQSLMELDASFHNWLP